MADDKGAQSPVPYEGSQVIGASGDVVGVTECSEP
ncbi:hypothetical protein ABH920_003190 [Catenulispora sp. EB89]